MTLSPGTRIGPYEISALIGAGGMGEVFLATDLNLGRSAAIKVLPPSLASDAERLARFEREGQTLASLNHPNIAQVFGFEKGEGSFRALAMEFVDGPTLAERIGGVPLPVDDAIQIAIQIADALESAHDHGIIHRDLKPLNIKVRPDGTVKVLDFGLAKAIMPGVESSGAPSHSPTITTPAMTHAGVVLGTASYMSPEQAKGRVVDRRTDIWAFGCVLFEMLTGKRAFAGEDVSDVMVAILRDEPGWALLPPDTPRHVRALLRRCLEKDPRKRLPHIGVARLDLLSAPESAVDAAPRSAVVVWQVVAAAAVMAAIGVPAWLMMSSPVAAPAPPVRVRAEVGARGALQLTNSLAVSPDGRKLAFVARPSGSSTAGALYVRAFDQLEPVLLAGTEGAGAPFFSPDGRWVAFFAGAALKKVATSGGAVVTLCPAPGSRGGSWGEDDTIAFAFAEGLHRVPAAGGTSQPISVPANTPPVTPYILPGGRGILYGTAFNSNPLSGKVMVWDAAADTSRELISFGRLPGYATSGHLTFVRAGVLFAVPFDLDALQVRGEAVPLVEGIYQSAILGMPYLSLSGNGTLAYEASITTGTLQEPVMWLQRAGQLAPLRTQPSTFTHPRFSPDGKRLAMAIADGTQLDIWVYEWERGIMTRITNDAAPDISPVWTPDGTGIVFASTREGGISNLYWQRADGTGASQRLHTSAIPKIPDDISRDGRNLILHEGDPSTGRQALTVLPIEIAGARGIKAGPPKAFSVAATLKANARFSPDGKWVAYTANDTGAFEIYVEPFPGPGSRVQISTRAAGGVAVWSPTENELYYPTESPQRLAAVAYTITNGEFVPAKPRPWSDATFSATPPYSVYGPAFDIHPDGRRFAVTPPVTVPDVGGRPGQVMLFFNLFDELRRLAPVKGNR